MAFEIVTLEGLRKSFEVIIEKFEGDSTHWTASIYLASHTGIGVASGVHIDIVVSARDGVAQYTCQPAFWGSRLPGFVPALHEALTEYWERL